MYWWTHWLYTHLGITCRTPSDGHQTNATRTNCMGGSGRNLWPFGPVQTANKLSIEKDIIYPCSLCTVGQPQSLSTVIAKAYSGATSHYWRKTDAHTLQDVKTTFHGATVQLPDSSTISATAVGRLPLPDSLNVSAKEGVQQRSQRW